MSTTKNFHLARPLFDSIVWHTPVNNNFTTIDALLATIAANVDLQGVWINATLYTVGQSVVDEDIGAIYECLVNHTSASTGAFSADRTANPTYWKISPYSATAVASLWAEEEEDVEVVTGKYSAKHWATKAAAYAALIPSSYTTLYDTDNDTKVETERTADDDTVRIKCGGTDVAAFTKTGVTFNFPITVGGDLLSDLYAPLTTSVSVYDSIESVSFLGASDGSVIYCLGARTVADGGHGFWRWASTAVRNIANGAVFYDPLLSWANQGTGGILLGLWIRAEHSASHGLTSGFKLEWLGTPTGATLLQAIAIATPFGWPVMLPDASINMGTVSITINPNYTALIAKSQCILDWTGTPTSGYGIRIAGATPSYERGFLQNRTVLQNVAIIGGDNFAGIITATGLLHGDGTNSSYYYTLENVTVQGWTANHAYSDNVWGVRNKACRFFWGTVVTTDSPDNFGERMSYDDCIFADGNMLLTLYGGDWTFDACAFINAQVVLQSDVRAPPFNSGAAANALFLHPHFETIDAASTYFVKVMSENSSARIEMPDVVLDSVYTTTDELFYCVSTNDEDFGITVKGLAFAQGPHYAPVGLGVVGGTGPCRVTESRFDMDNAYYVNAGLGGQLLRNGNLEAGTGDGWVEFGTTGVVTYTSSPGHTGSYYTTILVGTGFNKGIKQEIPCNPLDKVAVHGWYKGEIIQSLPKSANNRVILQLGFLDSAGAGISSVGYTFIDETAVTWQEWRVAAKAPPGTAMVQVYLFADCPDGTSVMAQFDDFVLTTL